MNLAFHKHLSLCPQAKEDGMPKVGKKHYPYTAKGKAAARKASKRTGKKMTSAKRKKY